jgi:predicted RNA-binding protein Jag
MAHWESFLKTLVERMGFGDFKAEVDESHRSASIVIYEQLPGFREHIPLFVESLNHLSQILAQKRGEAAMFIDVNNYRKEREKLLSELARAAARKVVATKQAVSLPAMNSYERRLIHMELAGRPDVMTESEGAGRERYVTVRIVGSEPHSASPASAESDTL